MVKKAPIFDPGDGLIVGEVGPWAERTLRGVQIATEDAKHANYHLHLVLYGLIEQLLERAVGEPLTSLDQVRIQVRGAPDPDAMTLPTFIDIG
jgi:hypothetical protein